MAPHDRTPDPPIDLKLLVRKAFLGPAQMPDIVTFAEHPSFIGDGGPGLFPRQRTALRLFYGDRERMTAYDEDVIEGWRSSFYNSEMRVGVPSDVWERIDYLNATGRRHFNIIENVGGRRGGKGHLGAVIAAYELTWLLSLGDPQAALGIAKGHHLTTMVAATEFRQARDAQFADISRMITQGKVFQGRRAFANRSEIAILTDADVLRCSELGITDERGVGLQASLRAKAYTSNAAAARGITASALFLDEFAHHAATDAGSTAEDVYRALTPSLAQMGRDALTYIPTSPWSRTGYAYKLYSDALEVDENGTARYPDMVVLQVPSHELYLDHDDPVATEGRTFVNVPFSLDDAQLRSESRDPRSFRTEIRAQWAEGEDTYLDPVHVDQMFASVCPRHGATISTGNTCDVCGEPGHLLVPQSRGAQFAAYRGHADPATTGSNFAMGIGHYDLLEDDEGEPVVHVFIDLVRVWRPSDYEDGRIPYHAVRDEVVELLMGFPTLHAFTIDQFGAFATVPDLAAGLKERRHRARVLLRNHTAAENLERWEILKAALSEGSVHMFTDHLRDGGGSLAAAELKALQYVNGRVRKPNSGPIRTDDLAVVISVLVAELLRDAHRRVPLRRALGSARLAAGPSARGSLGGLGPRSVLQRYPSTRIRNPYGRWVPPDPPPRGTARGQLGRHTSPES